MTGEAAGAMAPCRRQPDDAAAAGF